MHPSLMYAVLWLAGVRDRRLAGYFVLPHDAAGESFRQNKLTIPRDAQAILLVSIDQLQFAPSGKERFRIEDPRCLLVDSMASRKVI